MKSLNDKRAEWIECLYGDDINSIGFQVYALRADFASWWTINEARSFAPRDENGERQGWALLHGLLDRGFATSQMVAIRRLCDKYPIDDRKRGVWSLVSLLRDLGEHAALLTSEAVLAVEGLPDDLSEAERNAQHALRRAGPGPQVEFVRARKRHKDLDLLAGTTGTSRSRQDKVRPVVFARLQDHLETTCADICEKVNKFLAHAAAPHTRTQLLDDSSDVTPHDLRTAALTIKEVFDLLSLVVPPPRVAPGPQSPRGQMTICAAEFFDPLQHVDQPLVRREDVPHIRRARKDIKAQLSADADPRELLMHLGL